MTAVSVAGGTARAPLPLTIYVDCTNTTGIEDGTEANPFDTIQEGIAAATDGDTVVVRPCTYHQNLNFQGKAITVASTDPLDADVVGATIVNGSDYGHVVAFVNGEDERSVLEGLTITGGALGIGGIYCYYASPKIRRNVIADNVLLTDGGGIYCNNHSSPTITDNTIVGNMSGSHGGGIYCKTYSHPTIAGNVIAGSYGMWGAGICCEDFASPTISDNVIAGNDGDDGGGIYCFYSDATISGNIISGNTADFGGGINCFYPCFPTIVNNIICDNSADYGGGIYCYMAPPTITNNTIAGNSAGDGGGLRLSSASPAISNNIVALNSSGISQSSGSPVLRNNCLHNPGGDDYSGLEPGEGDIGDDPLLVDAAGGDYHLTADSPCIDAGWNDAGELPDTDMDGDPRPDLEAGIADMGADEWVSTPVRLFLRGGCWHLIALPCQPMNPYPWEVFDELRPPSKPVDLLSGSLYRYDPATQGYVMFDQAAPEVFGEIFPGVGYWLWLYDDQSFSYDVVPCRQIFIQLAEAGWHMAGSPQPEHTAWDDMGWYRSWEGPYPFSTVSQPGDPLWVQDPLYRWSSTAGGYVASGLVPGEDDCLRAFRGYWIYTFVDDLIVEVAAP